ncbi:MAG: DUF4332 domain-containing protein [Candidatus Bathyarchaeota archaeon]|nr:DUF4332 domain-containing protein [Candidatus Bathyarchaeota archaeon]
MFVKRGFYVWITLFATFLGVLFTFNAAMLLINEGATAVVSPYILGTLVSGLSAEAYLWISIVFTCIFMGLTCIIVYRKQPLDPELVKMLLKVGGNLAALRKTQESATAEVAEQMEYNRKVNNKFFSTVTTDIEANSVKTQELLANQEKVVKKVGKDVMAAIETKASESESKTSVELKKQEAVINSVKRLTEESSAALKTQGSALQEIRDKLEGIEGTMSPNQATIKSLDNPEEIKGIGPALGKELRVLGISSVGDFLTTDPVIIGEKTRVSQDMAENLQAMAQLMMVPGVDANDAELLIEAGIKSRRQLADQDVIVLSRKVGEVAKIYLDQGKITKQEYPTIEEIASWIRNA